MIGDAAADALEEVERSGEGSFEAFPVFDFAVFFAERPAGRDKCALVYMQETVGAEGGKCNEGKGSILFQLQMPFKAVGGIIGGAKSLDVHFFKQACCIIAVLGKHSAGLVPDFICACGRDGLINAKIALKLKMRPVVDGRADKTGHYFGEAEELFVVICLACNIEFVHTANSHTAPLIMVCLKPELSEVFISAALIYILGRKVVVIIDDGTIFCVAVEKLFGSFRAEEKILIHKFFHQNFSLFIQRPRAGLGMK